MATQENGAKHSTTSAQPPSVATRSLSIESVLTVLKVISANLNGVRSAAKKGFFAWMNQTQADVVCVQELKAQIADLTPELRQTAEGWHSYFHCAEKKGYSGVGIYSRQPAVQVVEGLGVDWIDAEGRYLRADFADCSVISLYLPSGSSSEDRQAVKFRFLEVFLPHLQALIAEGREIIICGDWNIAHQEIDLKNWKGNLKNSGFLPEERAWLSAVLAQGWVDVWRTHEPEQPGYTWWSQRGQAYANNVGWRIDYQIVTPKLAATTQRAEVFKGSKFSDHAPLVVEYGH